MRKIDINFIENIEVDGVDSKDYPDFCDAYFCSASWKDTGENLSDEELELLQEKYPELVHELALQKMMRI